MPDICYVCLSDMHLGADNSVLTTIKPESIETDPSQADAVLSQFVRCLRALIAQNESQKKPVLVLNGDILEMALCDTNKAAMVFERFIELIFPAQGEPLFDKHILYFPGNHDHHVWESARETQYIDFLATMRPGTELPPPWHTTKMVAPDLVCEDFLTSLLRRYPHLKDAVVNVAYPNYALFTSDRQRGLIFSHGHYVEAIYSLMSTLNTMFFPDRKKPQAIGELEAENFAWIDFFWSTMGRSGDVGQDIGLFYAKLQDRKEVEKLIKTFVTSWLAQTKQPKWAKEIEARGTEWIQDIIASKLSPLEKHRTDNVLSDDAQRGLQWYLETPLLKQLLEENGPSIPPDLTFLFGHTHKPFEQQMTFAGYPYPLKVYNSGGWVVDTVEISPVHGAAVLLIDEMLNTVSVRMYDQATKTEDYAASVDECTPSGSSKSAFYQRIHALVNASQDPWQTFSKVAAEAVRLHAQVLETKIHL